MSTPSCPSGKQAYQDEEEATQALWHVCRKYDDAATLHPYLCPQGCGYWHLGRSDQGYKKWKKRRAHERRVARARTHKERIAARRARPMLFLDVDGTLSPYGSGVTEGHVSSGEWTTLYQGRVSDLSVPYRPTVVERIMALRRADLIEVRWLTTWEPPLLSAWHEAGLGPFRPAGRTEQGRRRWWKANVVEQWMLANRDRRAIWVDDDITPGRLRGFDRARLLAISPDPSYGLTDDHLTRIEAWASRERYGEREAELVLSCRSRLANCSSESV